MERWIDTYIQIHTDTMQKQKTDTDAVSVLQVQCGPQRGTGLRPVASAVRCLLICLRLGWRV